MGCRRDRSRQSPVVRRGRGVALWRGAQPPHVGAVPDLLSRAGDYRTEAEASGAVPERADLRSPYLMSSLPWSTTALDRIACSVRARAVLRRDTLCDGVPRSSLPVPVNVLTTAKEKFIMPKALIFHSALALVWAMA